MKDLELARRVEEALVNITHAFGVGATIEQSACGREVPSIDLHIVKQNVTCQECWAALGWK